MALIGGRLAIDGELSEGYVEVDGERIASVGDELPAGPEALDAIDAIELEHGVTSYLASLISPDEDTLKRVLPELERRTADQDSPLVGVHVEGPWICPEFAGMHPPERLAPVPDEVPEWVRSPAVQVITLAPEL